MKLKRVLATLLCAAMVFTSNSVSILASEDISLVQDTENKTDQAEDLLKGDESDAQLPDNDSAAVEDETLISDGNKVTAPEEGEEERDEPTADRGGVASDFFQVAPDGTLTVVGYSSLAATNAASVCIPAGTTKIPRSESLFYNNNVVKTVTFESGGTAELVIEEGAFEGCSLTYFGGNENYYEIKKGTFQNCKELEEFNFKNVTSIRDNAFNGCTVFGKSISKLSSKGKISSIGDFAFKGCGFTSLDISGLLDKNDVTFGKSSFADMISLTSAYIPEAVEGIPEACFSGCTSLATLIFYNSGPIGQQAFKGCSKLKTIDFCNTTGIESYAFQNCTSLKTVNLPATIDGVDDNVVKNNAFDGCIGLTTATFNYRDKNGSVDKELVEEDAFYNVPVATLTISGYDGLLREYADRKGYLWKSLNDDIKIKLSSNFATYCTCGVTVKGKTLGALQTTKDYFTAKPGDLVVLVINQRLSNFGIVKDSLSDGKNTEFKFVSYKNYQYTYTCNAPKQDMTLEIKTYPSDAISKGSFTHSIKPLEDAEFERSLDGTSYNVYYGAGKKGRLDIHAVYDGQTYTIGEWMFNYKSSTPSVATITDKGEITVLKEGETTITATYKSNSSRKVSFKLYSNESVYVDEDNFTLEYDGTDGTVKPDFSNTETIKVDKKDIEVQVVEYKASDLNSSDQTFKVKLNAFNQKKEAMYVSASWSSADTSVATVKEAKNMTNSNIVTIKKGTIGDTMITASTTTSRKDMDLKNVVVTAYIIVRISDGSPKAVEDSLTVNVAKSSDDAYGGTQVTLVPISGYEIDGKLLKSGGDVYENLYSDREGKKQFNGLRLKYIETNGYGQHVYRLIATRAGETANVKSNEKLEYSGAKKLYVRIARDPEKDFYVPLKKIIIVNEDLAFNISPKGSINTFYDGKCYDPYTYKCEPELELKRNKDEAEKDYIKRYVSATVGTVTIANPVPATKAELWDVELISSDHYRKIENNNKKYIADPDDKLAKNFTITANNELTSFTIRRTVGDLEQEEKKDVVSGYLFFRFKGYSTIDPASGEYKNGSKVVPINIPVRTVAPSYTLTPGTVTDSKYNTNSEYKVKIRNTALDKVVINKAVLTKLEKDQSLNHKYFEDMSEGDIDDDGVITITMKSMPVGKQQLAFKVKRINWAKETKYTFTTNITDKDPSAKLSVGKVTLNNNLDESTGEIKLTLSQISTKVLIKDDEIVYTGKGDASDIDFDVKEGETPNILIIKPKISSGAAKGSYKFAFVPQYQYGGGTARDLKKLTFTVAITDAQPSVSLSTASYTFNFDKSEYAGIEVYKPLMTFKSVTVGKDDEIDVSGAAAVPLKVKPENLDDAEKVGEALEFDTQYNETKKKHELIIKIKDISDLPMTKFSFNYDLTGIKVFGAELKPVKITVKGITADTWIVLKAGSSVNTVDDRSYVKYTATVKNLANTTIDEDITVYEYDYEEGDGKKVSERFRAVRDADNDKITKLYEIIGEGEERFENKSYELELEYSVSGVTICTNTFKVKPSQNLPKIKIDPAEIKFVGARDSEKQVARVNLTKTSVLHSHISNAKIKDSNAKIMKDAFEVNYVDIDEKDYIPDDAKTCYAGYLEITCTNPTSLKRGVKYQLSIELELDGQFQKQVKVKQDDGTYEYEWQKTGGRVVTVPLIITM